MVVVTGQEGRAIQELSVDRPIHRLTGFRRPSWVRLL